MAMRNIALFGILVLEFISNCFTLRILGIFPINVYSHFVVCERIVTSLAEKGHRVDVYSHFPRKAPLPNYQDFSLSGSLPKRSNKLTYDVAVQFKGGVDIRRMRRMAGEPICNLLGLPIFQKLIHDPPNDPPYDLIILEVFSHDCYLALKLKLNVPVVGIIIIPIHDWLNYHLGSPFNEAVTPISWSEYSHPMTFWQRTMNTILYYLRNIEYYYYLESQDETVENFFGTGFPSVTNLVEEIDLLLVNTHSSLDGIRPLTPNIIEVGGIHIHDDGTKMTKSIESWLHASKNGFIYIAFGSMVRIETFPIRVLNAFYDAFRNITPVRVLMKISKPEELPTGLPENVLVQPWLPQIKVLSHKNIRAYITHGGLMSTQESIYCGVPIIGMPIFNDQFTNINSYVRKGIAIRQDFDKITGKSLTNAIIEILHNETFKNNAMKLSMQFRDRPMTAIDTAMFWIEYITRHGQHALRPPIVDLPWWQAYLIDIYVFLLLFIMTSVYCLKYLMKKSFMHTKRVIRLLYTIFFHIVVAKFSNLCYK